MGELQTFTEGSDRSDHTMKAGPRSPQPQKYTNKILKDKLNPKVPFPKLKGKSSQR